MQQLQFAELDDHGRLVLEDGAGNRYALPVDDRVRAALRPRRVQSDPERAQASTTPREVQAMIRAGQTAEEVASATGWELARVQRFEGPVLAEREHVVGLAKAAHVRAQGRTDGSHTLDRRVRERLQTRGVNPSDVSWDAARTEAQGPWTVLVVFEAGGRERRAAWHYDVQDRSIDALDDEARWLSEDEQALPGGLAGHPLLGTSTAADESNDLMATMRARRQRRQRRTPKKVDAPSGSDDATTAGADGKAPGGKGAGAKAAGGKGARTASAGMVDEVLPLEDLAFDEATMGTPPAAHPRGSAVESPTPIIPDDVEEQLDDAEPELVTETDVDDRADDRADEIADEPVEESVEGAYARTRHDPYEVSFDEFFGTDDDYDDEDEFEDDDTEDGDLEGEDGHDGVAAVEMVDGGQDDHLTNDEFDAPESVATDTSTDDAHDDRDDDEDSADVDSADVDSADVDSTDVEAEERDAEDDAPSSADETAAGSAPAKETEQASTEGQGSGKRKGRPSVPSWDDIMFGSGGKRR